MKTSLTVRNKWAYVPLVLFIWTIFFIGCSNPVGPENQTPNVIQAELPEITKDIDKREISIPTGSEITFTVEAVSKDNGTISYKWYKASDEKGVGTLIEGQTSNTLKETVSLQEGEEQKIVYYYAEITNTIGEDKEAKSNSITSKRIKVVINNLVSAAQPVITLETKSYEGFTPEQLVLNINVSFINGLNGNVSVRWVSAESLEEEGIEIKDANTFSYTIPKAELSGTKYYWCEVTNTISDNNDGGVKSKTTVSDKIKVSIIEPNVSEVTNNLFDQTITSGNEFTLSVEAKSNDNGIITYKWYKASSLEENGTLIENENNNIYKETITLDAQQESLVCYYYVEVTNTITINGVSKSNTIKSNVAKITINNKQNAKAPEILGVNDDYSDGKPEQLTLSISAKSSDNGNLSYQWYKANNTTEDGTLISNATSYSYSIPQSDLSSTTYYWCVVTNTIPNNNDGGNKSQSTSSKKIKVTILEALSPSITQDLVDINVKSNNLFTLSIKASSLDNGNLSYKWYKATDLTTPGILISGEATDKYSTIIKLDTLEKEKNFYYYVEITNTIGTNNKVSKSVTSKRAKVTVFNNNLGYNYPSSGKYSPVDTNGNVDGFGWDSKTYPLGATVQGNDTTFAVFSKNADKVLLEIYDKSYGKDAIHDYWMEKGSDDIWRARVSGVGAGTLYAFRCWGPNWKYDDKWSRGNSSVGFVSDFDTTGNRFNPNKVLFDPYAKEITHDKSNPEVFKNTSYDAGMYGTGEEDYKGVVRRNFDTGKYAPKGVVVNDNTYFGTKPAIPQEKARIYEAHVRGLTKHSSTMSLKTILNGINGFENVKNIPENKQGTYAGAALMAPYLKALGINTIELLPVHETDNDHNSSDSSSFVDGKPTGNFWGYMTYGYFAPDRRYSSDKSYGGPTREFKEMVKAFHDQGIEVYLDVVFNHSGEGGPWYNEKDNYKTAELTFMRGFDCSEYYCLSPSNVGDHWQTTGCGNNLRCDNAVVRNLIIDSLTYWLDNMGVDGFRFDLAPVIGREFNNTDWQFNGNAQTIKDIITLGNNKNAEMIAEAWDIGEYGVGKFPDGWGEWNGRYRDSLRGFVNAGNPQAKDGSVTQYINGDYDNFNDQGGPEKSVNFIVAHDGFTLADLCSYEGNGNALNSTLSWPFGPSDGGNGDHNSLAFGTTPEMKRQANRNYIAIQMMSRGVPMIVYGDEFSRTQNGNNNPYNIDSVATWNNYNMINTSSPHSISGENYHNNFGTFDNLNNINGNFMFMKYMLDLKANEVALNQGDYNVPYNFRKEDGTSTLGNTDRCIWLHIDGDQVQGGSDYLVFMNMYTDAVDFTIPNVEGKSWVKLVDTAKYGEGNYNYWNGDFSNIVTDKYNVNPWSVVILKQRTFEKTADPVINAAGDTLTGTNFTDKINITLSTNTQGAEIFYTLDGSIPTTKSTKYTGAFTINSTTTVKAIAVKKDYIDSDVLEKTYTNTLKLSLPILSIPEGDFWNSITVFVTSDDKDVQFRYTTDNTEPLETSTLYEASKGIDISTTATIKVVAYKGSIKSDVVTAKYTKQNNTSYTENPYGVMLQGFNWDSAPRGGTPSNPNPNWGTWYKEITKNAELIKNKFEYVWFPPASKTDFNSSEGYAPTELNDLNSYYGTSDELKAAIQAISPSKPIADIVVNHRAGTSSWGDFQNPKWTEDYFSICSDDEGFSNPNSPMLNAPNKGNKDSGEAYGAYRDLDHTNTAVQKGIASWMNTVLKRVGFTGWRYDFVKGFGGKYVGQYNDSTNPSMSVGEYWPSSEGLDKWKSEIDNWIIATSNSSRAFDFVLKANMNEAFGWIKDGNTNDSNKDKWNLSLLASENSLMRYNSNAAVTFIDNHDTGSTQQHWELDPGDLGPAYVFLLTHPGYPCVAYQHYFAGEGEQYRGADIVPGTSNTFQKHIDFLIDLRKSVGIKNTNAIEVLDATTTNYVAKITGTNSEIIVKIGGDAYNPNVEGYKNRAPIYTGVNFTIWEKNKGEVLPELENRHLTFTVKKDSNNATWLWEANAKIYLWAWDATKAGCWIECTGSGASVEAEVPNNIIGVKLVRFADTVTTPDWKQSIWNESNDCEINQSSTNYEIIIIK